MSSRPCPWLRFWARSLDMVLYTQINVWLFVSIVSLSHLNDTTIFLVAGLFLFMEFIGWIFIEAIIISLFGSTLGHWLFTIKVRNRDGSRLTYDQALSRTKWLFLTGLGLHILSPATYLISYIELMGRGQTHWDRRGNLVVTNGLPSAILIVRSLLIMLALTVLFQVFIQLSPLKAWQNELGQESIEQMSGFRQAK